ncbi:hypothetical protein [uncultured Microbacterium sp.]|uniref:hypothetical protein n=1 Tax=uncultured Microbacterium sp. TaxID=191216 RepID=UPI0025D3D850|nr:hypothetical protein [uncultured Microbacterium sp.]
MTDPRGRGGAGGLAPPVATAFAVAGFFALVIAGFGMLSLFTGAEVLAVSGLGQLPGIVGGAFAVGAFGVSTWFALRAERTRYGSALIVMVATFLAYLVGVPVGGVLSGVDAARVVAAVGGFATSWFAVVLAAAALVAGWAAIALVRTAAERPRWPWERDED